MNMMHMDAGRTPQQNGQWRTPVAAPIIPTGTPEPMEFTCRVETFTPEQAQAIITWQDHLAWKNRPVKKTRLRMLERVVAEGRFAFNGETIIFGPRGELIDGQHRLLACVATGIPIKALVVRGVPIDVMNSVDQGWARQGGDALSLRDESNYNTLAASARIIWALRRGTLNRTGLVGNPTPQNYEIVETIEDNPGLRRSVSFISARAGASKLVAPAIASAVHYLCTQSPTAVDAAGEADAFFAQLMSGENLDRSSSAFHMRKRILQWMQQRQKPQRAEVYALLVLSWNLRNRPVGVLRWRADQDIPTVE